MTLWIMEILRDYGNASSWEVAKQTMKKNVYVRQYLYRLRKYGIASKHEDFWFLTDFGKYLTSIVCRDRDRDRDRSNTRVTEEIQKSNTRVTLHTVQSHFDVWLHNSDLGTKEKEVVEVLLEHFKKTGSKFLYFSSIYDVAERFKMSPDQVNQVFMNLKQDHVGYCWKDKTHNAWKVALYKGFVEALEKEAKA